jgi:membrane protease YdiL (CAAX protease family)
VRALGQFVLALISIVASYWILLSVTDDQFKRGYSRFEDQMWSLVIVALAYAVPILLYATAFRTLSGYGAWFRIPSSSALITTALIGAFVFTLWLTVAHYRLVGPEHVTKVKLLLGAPTVVIAILFGVAIEEIVFRGFLLTEASRAFGPTAAIVISSLVFWAFHVPIWHGQFAIPFRGTCFNRYR